MVSSRVVRAVMLGMALGAAFAACAKGNQLGVGGGGVGGSTTVITGTGGGKSDAAPPTGGIGSPCPDGACATGTCTLIGDTKYCTTACPPTCPQGTYCSIISGNPICVPDLGQQCAKCTAATDCKLPSDNCLTAPLGDSFCAMDCSVDGMCPNGFVCTSMGGYASDAGTDAGADGGGAGGGGTGGADASGIPSAANMWCVPDEGASCPCNMGRDGVTNTCFVTNTLGTCPGTETCSGATSMWMGCSATTPMAEICNGKDDDCNGMIDDGDPDTLCASMGAPPPNGNWACVNGMCQLGTCDPGFTAYPSGNTTTGCTCPVDTDEPNDVCAMATVVGPVKASITTPLVIQGTLSTAGDVDVYSLMTTDDTLTSSNAYHVSVSFTAPANNTEFVMDVIRGNFCLDVPVGAGTSITMYDWCVSGNAAGPIGESPCGNVATQTHCGTNHSSQYYIRVYRAPGATGTCTQYQLSVTGGGGACDFTQQCM